MPTSKRKSSIRARREYMGIPLAGAAKALGVSELELTRWEASLAGVSDAHLRDLAVFYELNVSDLLGAKSRKDAAISNRFALRDLPGPLYGTLRLVFSWGVREYPISEAARERTLARIDCFNVQNEEPESPWIMADTMNNRLLFINTDHLEGIELIGDDAEASPPFEHPEVYRALSWSEMEDGEFGPILQSAVARLVEAYPSQEDAIRASNSTLAINPRGQESFYDMIELDDTVGPFDLELACEEKMPRNGLVRLMSEGYYVAKYVNLRKTALIEVPIEAYLLASDVAEMRAVHSDQTAHS